MTRLKAPEPHQRWKERRRCRCWKRSVVEVDSGGGAKLVQWKQLVHLLSTSLGEYPLAVEVLQYCIKNSSIAFLGAFEDFLKACLNV